MTLKNSSTRGDMPRIAMIGCGAIAERYHLPGLAKIPGALQSVVLVDRSEERCQHMARAFGIERRASDIRDVIDEIDAAIVAVPPAAHFTVCSELLSRELPVLCEKPLAETFAEGQAMVALAREHDAPLCVNHTRRVLPAYVEIKRLLDAGEIGSLTSIRWEEGCKFDWPAATAFQFRSGARGVLLDTGIHSIDLLCWWLNDAPQLVSCETDSFGGPEAMADLALRRGSCQIVIRLSWLSRLSNRYTIVGERGTITGSLDHVNRLTITSPSGRRKAIRLRTIEETYSDFGARIIANFVEVIADRAKPLVSAESVLPALGLMSECYDTATRMDMPWLEPEEDGQYACA
jgi:predicted dehydrogenase